MPSTRIIRRETRKMPSVRKHGFSAILFLALIILSTYAWLQFFGKRVNQSPVHGPEFKLDKPEKLLANGATEELPDLLSQDNIPQDVNPTETMDLLGGPKQVPTNGPRPPSSIAPNLPNTTKTILIDGSPLGGATEIGNTSPPLTRAPIQGLSRKSPFGLVPSPDKNGRTALGSYGKPFSPIQGQNYISLIVGGLGLNPALTQRAINELPSEVSLSFAAQTPNLQNWIDRARARGHEVLLELPMQNDDENSGVDEYLLTVSGPHSKNIRNLDYLLSRAQGYFAVTNYGGESLLKNDTALKPILDHVHNAGLGFIYDDSIAGSTIGSTASKTSLFFTSAHGMIDNDAHDRKSVAGQISSLPVTGKNISIGMGFSYSGTVDGILDWVRSNTNTKLAPASYALKAR